MNLLDTNVLSHLQKQDPVGNAIVAAMAASTDRDFQITAVNAYEMLGGSIELIRDLMKRRWHDHGRAHSLLMGSTT